MPLERLRPPLMMEMEPGDVLALISDGIDEYQDFGEARVREIIAAHHRKPVAGLAAILLDAVKRFAAGAPHEDDMTIVLVKREGASGSFPRRLDALARIFDFTAREVDAALRPSVDLALEELFTNVVKYGRSSETPVRIGISRIARGVEVTLTDSDADFFDTAGAPAADTSLPIEQRQPGGLGIHLARKVVDAIDYRYSAQSRTSRTTFRKTRGKEDVHD